MSSERTRKGEAKGESVKATESTAEKKCRNFPLWVCQQRLCPLPSRPTLRLSRAKSESNRQERRNMFSLTFYEQSEFSLHCAVQKTGLGFLEDT